MEQHVQALISSAVIVALLIGTLPAHAEPEPAPKASESPDAEEPEIKEEEPLWEVALASYARSGPAYPASDETQTDFIPLPFPIYRGKFLRVGDSNEKPITARIFRRDRIKLDLDFGLNLPVDSKS